ncbi:MAG: hypothetical protein HYR91_05330 [Flavobacteriia bacterium]|nr:hypothetical protein [Flavobacteriia bacterium]
MNKLFTLTVTLLLSATSLFAQDDNSLIGRAKGAAHNCLQDFNSNQWNITANVNDISICFVDGTIKEVTFIATPKLSGDIYPLVRIMPIVIASVQFDCNGNIISEACY